jgi:hypothetical protein
LALLQGKKIIYAIAASVASGIRIVGAILLVPIGLLGYMVYLFKETKDPFMFIHVQPAFGANRSGDELVILPQVYWRYLNIFVKVPITNYDWWIALLEIILFHVVLVILFFAWRKNYPKQWIYFSAAAVILPTLTGTLSSMPRYVLVAFPVFIFLAALPKKIRTASFIASIVLGTVLTILFTQGYWVS